LYLDVLIDNSNKYFIYSGILVDYHLDRDGGLEYLYLTETTKQYLTVTPKESGFQEEEKSEDDNEVKKGVKKIENERFFNKDLESLSPEQKEALNDELKREFSQGIPGAVFVIPYKTVKNINITYYQLDKYRFSQLRKIVGVYELLKYLIQFSFVKGFFRLIVNRTEMFRLFLVYLKKKALPTTNCKRNTNKPTEY
jgi:hypothetical protein